MRNLLLRRVSVLCACLVFSLPALAGKFSAADFPLRVHVVFRNGIRHYYRAGGYAPSSSLDEVDGLGKANLFANGQPLGFDFNYQCSQPITPQTAFETFMARWKKQGRDLEIVMPVMGGKPGDMNSCDLKVIMKTETVYVRRDNGIEEEPAAQYKEWMVRHQYDPEHGKDFPVSLKGERPAQPGNAEPMQ